MQVVIDSREASLGDWTGTAGVQLVLPFVTDASRSGVDLVGKSRVRAVELIWVDSDNGSVLFVHTANDLAIASD